MCEVVGVTLPHPQGQIYALPIIPSTLEKELQTALEHQKDTEVSRHA